MRLTPLSSRPARYSWTQIGLHWLVAALVLAQYATSGAIVRTHQMRPLGQQANPTDLFLHTVHNRVGLLIVVAMALRLAVRLWRGAPAPLTDPDGWTARLARTAHWAFYAILIAQGITGAIATYFWWPISAVHVFLFKILLGLLGVHIAAALWHGFVRRDDTLMRMFRA
jgi:cytochrome b561